MSSDKIKTVVIVDDDKVQHMINRKILLRSCPDLCLQFFESPLTALDWLAENQADLLLLDINMPEMKGWEFLEILESKSIELDVKMLTSSMDADDVEKSKKYRLVSGFLIKPLNKNEVEVLLN
ncbi:response regulator [Litoribacter ruber]|uniref:Response regulator n=1 Tax=Litoribacter ruber TaxID=702568 RepID=A0AAP2CK88_9BACT|nr:MULTISPECIES: response regulator [Litoribacter]MBS9524771.1 response regulator [Litoribacter alkaliphilus]MBT0812646.1 response regulator [Litoribacter ruber]